MQKYCLVALGAVVMLCLQAGREKLEKTGHPLQDGGDEGTTGINRAVSCLIYYCFVMLEVIHAVTLEGRSCQRPLPSTPATSRAKPHHVKQTFTRALDLELRWHAILYHLDNFPKTIAFTLRSDSQDTTRRPHCLHEEGALLDQMLAACQPRNQAYGVRSSRLQSRQRPPQGSRSDGSK
jgi:hypothetical protein